MDDITRNKLIENGKYAKTNACGGFKHCTDRICDPNDDDCKECIEDYEKALKERYLNDY